MIKLDCDNNIDKVVWHRGRTISTNQIFSNFDIYVWVTISHMKYQGFCESLKMVRYVRYD